MSAQLSYLMETDWVQPEPVRAVRTRFEGMKGILLETRVGQDRVDYYLDGKTHLPVVIMWPKGFRMYRLAGYAEVSGIQLPHRVLHRDAADVEQGGPTFQFRVRYEWKARNF